MSFIIKNFLFANAKTKMVFDVIDGIFLYFNNVIFIDSQIMSCMTLFVAN